MENSLSESYNKSKSCVILYIYGLVLRSKYVYSKFFARWGGAVLLKRPMFEKFKDLGFFKKIWKEKN